MRGIETAGENEVLLRVRHPLKLIKFIVNAGIPKASGPQLAKKVALTNKIMMIMCVLITLMAWSFVAAGLPGRLLATMVLAFYGIFALCLTLNQRGHFWASRLLLLLLMNLLGLAQGWVFSPASHFEIGSFFMITLPMILFEATDSVYIGIASIMTVVVFLAIVWFAPAPKFAPRMSEHALLVMRSGQGVGVLLSIYLVIHHFNLANFRAERKLEAALEELRKEQERSIFNAKMAAVGTLAGGVAHEINNPLTVVTLGIALLKRNLGAEADSEEMRELFSRVASATHRIKTIIHGLLIFVGQGAFSPKSDVKINDFLGEIFALFGHRLRELNIEFRYNPPRSDEIVSLNLSEISQVLFNLVSNSIDAIAAEREKWIQLDVDLENDGLELAVTNSGSRIPPEIARRMFEPFFTTKPVGGGVGMGLSVCKGIVESLGGSIFYDAESPHSRFVFRVPVRRGGSG